MSPTAYEGRELEVAQLVKAECPKCQMVMDWQHSDVAPAVYISECCGVKYTAVPQLYQITNVEAIH